MTLAQLQAAALSGIVAGIEYLDVSFNPDGSVASVHDNVNGLTYVFTYDAFGELLTVYNGSKQWSVSLLAAEKVASIIH